MGPSERDALRYDGVHCNLLIQHIPPDVFLLKISGNDVGEFGDAPMTALGRLLGGHDAVQFFIDAREVRGASIEVSGEWARWLEANKPKLRSVTMLTGSRFVQITAEFVRRFAALEGIMRVCTEAAVFDTALAHAVQQP